MDNLTRDTKIVISIFSSAVCMTIAAGIAMGLTLFCTLLTIAIIFDKEEGK